MLRGALIATLLLAVTAVPAAGQRPADTLDALRRDARNAAFRYEFALRRHVPSRFGGGYGTDCDEIIGRFCFTYNDRDNPASRPAPDPPEVVDARTVAIAVHRRWFGAAPAESDAAGPLLRYLIEAERTAEAVSAARAHAWAAERTTRSLMLLGLALHHNAEFDAAEAVFDSARARLDPEARRRLDSIEPLLDPAEARHYRRLDDAGRQRYEARFWALADPFLSQPGNERRSAHYARHALGTVLAETPRVRGMLSWGDDHTEILLRFGVPVRRERMLPSMPTLSHDVNMIEMFDPRAVAFVFPALATRGVPPLPGDPDIRAEMERDTARSVYTPITYPRTRALTAQAALFPARHGGLLTLAAALAPDTIEPYVPVAPRGLLVVLDTAGVELNRTEVRVRLRDDSVLVVRAEVAVPPGPLVYHLEVTDDSTGLAALSRYALALPETPGMRISDVLVAEAFGDSLPRSVEDPALSPLPGTRVPAGGAVGLFAQVRGLDRGAGASRYAVEWSIEPAERPGLLARAARWVGRQIGVVGEEQPVRVRWEDQGDDDVATIAFSLDLADLEPGLYRVTLAVLDQRTGERRSAAALLRITG